MIIRKLALAALGALTISAGATWAAESSEGHIEDVQIVSEAINGEVSVPSGQ